MVVFLAGGGTAGHINPAISIARFIKDRKPDARVIFAGTPKGLENKLVEDAGFEIRHIDVSGFKRSLSTYNFKAAAKLLPALKQAGALIDEIAPDIVIGTGGYVSGPVVFAAARRGIPTAIHEQNAYPGVTSRILSSLADRVMISFEDSKKYFKGPEKLILVGNPVRQEMLFAKTEEARKKLSLDTRPLVLSFGGSLGARELNERIIDFILLHTKEKKIQHMHAAGKYGWRWMPGRLREKGVDISGANGLLVSEYIYNMPDVMAAADLVICRAGAITLSELAVLSKPAVLIPSPNVTNNHQYHNAMAYVKAGAAVMQREKDATGATIKQSVDELLFTKGRLEEMSAAAEKLAIFDSTQKIYDLLFEMLKTRKEK